MKVIDRMKSRFLMVALLALLPTAPVLAGTCSNPTGNEGETLYNNDYHTMQLCNGTKWIGWGGASVSGGASANILPVTSVSLTADNTLIDPAGMAYLTVTSNNGTASNRTFCLKAGTVGQRLIIENLTNNDFELQEAAAGSQPCGAGSESTDTNGGTLVWGNQGDIREFIYDVNSFWRQLY